MALHMFTAQLLCSLLEVKLVSEAFINMNIDFIIYLKYLSCRLYLIHLCHRCACYTSLNVFL